eukprot:TRINITY_DN5269_c0_g1_i1.p2 TRINITY_DN5269_c0_g1~~TRINITY_DN5269_c0_g1_i1.p2  ORF type:complete len:102 (-),score=24.70 TRINITY_DN5269_c0_g1_i1:35-340(-)
MLRSLVGSEMCIRDSTLPELSFSVRSAMSGMHVQVESVEGGALPQLGHVPDAVAAHAVEGVESTAQPLVGCLLYTSDAADEEDSVDLGGRRVIKKQKHYVK